MKPSVFIDSNVWFSAFYKDGICSKLLENTGASGQKICISELVLEEIIRNVQLKIPSVLPLFINYVKENKICVLKNPSASQLLRYQGLAEKCDLPILVAAIEFKCNFFITGNLKDFNFPRIKKVSNIIIISPREYLEKHPRILTKRVIRK